MWTAWDYLGEAGIGVPVYRKSRGGFNRPYPCVLAGCGAFDLTGEAQTPARYASVVWGQSQGPYLAVRPLNHSGEKYFFGMWRGTDAIASWSWDGMEGKNAQIEVYSQGKETELFLNDVSLGRKPLREKRAFFEVPYCPGKLQAVSYDENGEILGENTLQSAKQDTCLMLRAEKMEILADGEDLLYAVVEVTDPNGIRKMLDDRRIHVEVSGAAYLAGLGSANPYTTDAFSGNVCDTFYGRMIVIARSNGRKGEVIVRAACEGLEEQEIIIPAVAKNLE